MKTENSCKILATNLRILRAERAQVYESVEIFLSLSRRNLPKARELLIAVRDLVKSVNRATRSLFHHEPWVLLAIQRRNQAGIELSVKQLSSMYKRVAYLEEKNLSGGRRGQEAEAEEFNRELRDWVNILQNRSPRNDYAKIYGVKPSQVVEKREEVNALTRVVAYEKVFEGPLPPNWEHWAKIINVKWSIDAWTEKQRDTITEWAGFLEFSDILDDSGFVRFANLKSVGSLTVHDVLLSAPKLAVAQRIRLHNSLGAHLSAMRQVEHLTIEANRGFALGHIAVSEFQLTGLERAGWLEVKDFPTLILPSLTEVHGLEAEQATVVSAEKLNKCDELIAPLAVEVNLPRWQSPE